MSAEEMIARQRRFRLALFRVLLASAYLAVSLFFADSGVRGSDIGVPGAFLLYSLILLAYHSHPRVETFSLLVLFLDLLFLLLLAFGGSSARATLAAVSYVFLVLQSRVLHGAREVLLIASAVTIIYYASFVQRGAQVLVIPAYGVLFLLAFTGTVAFLSFDRRHASERRISTLARQSTRSTESASVAAIQEALKELASWFRCSHALLAFWDKHEHFCLCQFPPPDTAPSPAQLDDRREWSILVGQRLDFTANNVAKSDNPNYDLAPSLVLKFHILNAVGCGLYVNGEAIGRLLLINRVSRVDDSDLRRLRMVAPAFTDLALHLLALKAAEQAAADHERNRLGQDFHDGPLQSVISFQMRVHMIRRLLERDPAAAVAELDQLQDLAQRQVTEMRTFVRSMRPVEVDTASVTAAARRLVDDFQKESGVPVTFISSEEPITAPGRLGVDILQLIREALNNIQKHAQATHVQFSLEKNEDHLTISVNDNGKGFRFGGTYNLQELEALRLGPNSIKQRLRALGGDITLESRPGQGSNLKLSIPLY